MKAIVRRVYGPADVLRLAEVPMPVVGDRDVLVRVAAASLNQADLDYLTGRPLLTRLATGLRRPRSRRLGLDAAGTVEAVGSEVRRFRPGDAVFGDLTRYGYGAFAEYVCAPETAWAPVPSGLSLEEAATLPQSAVLALQGLRVGWGPGAGRRVRSGDRVLVNGASGNVGPFAVRIAKAAGAHVTGVCSGGKMDLVRGLGADEVIDHAREDVTAGGPRWDWVVDVAGTRSILAWRRALRAGGTYVMVSGPTWHILQGLVLGPVISLAGSRKMGLMLWWKPFAAPDVATLTGLAESGVLVPAIDRRYPLSEVPDALRYVGARRARGKVVISIGNAEPAVVTGAVADGRAASAPGHGADSRR